jgi:hypothetical protein
VVVIVLARWVRVRIIKTPNTLITPPPPNTPTNKQKKQTHTHTNQVGLLVLDSVGFPFRHDACFQTEKPVNTSRVVGLMARELCRMAQDRQIAVRVL